MTCGRTNHTKFSSAPSAGLRVESMELVIDGVIHKFGSGTMHVSPLTNVPAGVYDNKTTMRREHWAWDRLTKKVVLSEWLTTEALVAMPEYGRDWPRWGHYPDLPKGEALGGETYTFGDAE